LSPREQYVFVAQRHFTTHHGPLLARREYHRHRLSRCIQFSVINSTSRSVVIILQTNARVKARRSECVDLYSTKSVKKPLIRSSIACSMCISYCVYQCINTRRRQGVGETSTSTITNCGERPTDFNLLTNRLQYEFSELYPGRSTAWHATIITPWCDSKLVLSNISQNNLPSSYKCIQMSSAKSASRPTG